MRRNLQYDQPSTSSGITHDDDFPAQLESSGDFLRPWTVKTEGEDKEIKLELKDDIHCIPKYTVIVNESMEFTVYVYHWPIPEDHSVYCERKRRVSGMEDCKALLQVIESSNLCNGLPQDQRTADVTVDPTSDIDWSDFPKCTVIRHSVPKVMSASHFLSTVAFRAPDCEVIWDILVDDGDESTDETCCHPCAKALSTLEKYARRKQKTTGAPAKAKAPLTACSSEKLVATVKSTRLECKQLEGRVRELEERIRNDGVHVSSGLENDLLKIMGGQNLEATPHMKFFWEQQMKLLKSKKMGRRYHPQIIRFALSLHGKSPAAYRELRDSGALVLPSERVLRDYKNYFKPKAGINPENVENLREKAAPYLYCSGDG